MVLVESRGSPLVCLFGSRDSLSEVTKRFNSFLKLRENELDSKSVDQFLSIVVLLGHRHDRSLLLFLSLAFLPFGLFLFRSIHDRVIFWDLVDEIMDITDS